MRYTAEIWEHKERLGEQELDKYVDEVYKYLMTMKKGIKLFLDRVVKKENHGLFLAIVKMYIDETKDYTIEITNNYEAIRKI